MTLFQQLLQARNKFQAAKTMMDQASEECSQIISRLEREFIGATPTEPDILFIQEAIAHHYGISLHVIASRLRTGQVYEARMVACVLCVDLTSHVTRRIAECFNAESHTTVYNAIKALKNRLQVDARFAKTYAELKRSITLKMAEHFTEKSA